MNWNSKRWTNKSKN